MAEISTDQIWIVGANALAKQCEEQFTTLELNTVKDLLDELSEFLEVSSIPNHLDTIGITSNQFEMWAANTCIKQFQEANPNLEEELSSYSETKYLFTIFGFCIMCLRDRAKENLTNDNFEFINAANGLILVLTAIQDRWKSLEI